MSLFYFSIFLIFFFLASRLACSKNLKQKFLILTFVFLISFIFPVLHKFMSNVGTDSLMEAQNFDVMDAQFYLQTIWNSMLVFFRLERAIIFVAFYFFIFAICFIGYKKYRPSKIFEYTALISGLLIFLNIELSSIQLNSVVYKQVVKNFDSSWALANKELESNPLNMVIYIGESTSSQHMSLYGYPQETTPFMSDLYKRGELVRFDGLSTHPHTSQSLLSAFSLPQEIYNHKPIYKQKRISLVEILSLAGKSIELISNQGSSGVNNLTQPVIFKGTEIKTSQEGLILGEKDDKTPRPYDHRFFKDTFVDQTLNTAQENKIYFLHSYAGHGPYERYLPDNFFDGGKSYLEQFSEEQIYRNPNEQNLKNIHTVKVYDQVVRYIDSNIHMIIEAIKARDEPFAFIYFSDHGDDVFNGIGHDGARLEFSMVTSPFIVYFNSAARKQFSNKWQALKEIDSEMVTLDWLSKLILDLLDINITGIEIKDEYKQQWKIEEFLNPYIVNRETNNGDVFTPTRLQEYQHKDDVDLFIGTYIAKRTLKDAPVFCLHQSNDVMSIIKGLFIGDCLEFDIVYQDDKFNVYHPPMEDKGFALSKYLDFISFKQPQLWLDAKNIFIPGACQALIETIDRADIPPQNYFVEFPPETKFDDPIVQECAQIFSQKGIQSSYYLNPADFEACEEGKANDQARCHAFNKNIQALTDLKVVKNVSFDKSLMQIVQADRRFDQFDFNSWAFYPFELVSITNKNEGKYKRLIYRNRY